MRRWTLIAGLVAILAVPALATQAGAGSEDKTDILPTLTVEKVVENGPGTGDFVVLVTCVKPEKDMSSVFGGDGPFVTVLVFDQNGAPKSATPPDGWVQNSGWTFQGWELVGRNCTIVEINQDGAIAVRYTCEFTSTPVIKNNEGANEELVNDLVPGCAEAQSDVQASVQYGFPWYPRECLEIKGTEAAEKPPLCREDAVVTVYNTMPEPEPPVPPTPITPLEPAAVAIEPTFTG